MSLETLLKEAAARGRRHAEAFDGGSKEALPWKVIEAFDAEIRGHVERDRRIEDERDRVLIAAVKLAETPMNDEEAVAVARRHLVRALDYLEEAVLRFGRVNRQAAARGHGEAGAAVASGR
ncbi:hypothetical protein MMB17_17375 [Methylobacterium organophilum]|uniref:hypothetical protein n=1 Tax=Methylobacterium organophilum TaxID=410 RepID=UPI001F138683|nr:hypothetical protein [Methylobacterium organophilum]UMY16461.1 hypothetical protein MMB17_17375 [Methylobacterium organophilum]